MVRRNRDSEKGIVVLEMALVSTMVMMLLSGVFDLANYFQTRSRIQYASSQAARFAITGQQVEDPDDPGTLLSREASIIHILTQVSGIEYDDSEVDVLTVAPDGSLVDGPGGPGDIVLVRVQYELEVVTPGLKKLFDDGMAGIRCSARFRNEEFENAAIEPCGDNDCGATA